MYAEKKLMVDLDNGKLSCLSIHVVQVKIYDDFLLYM